MDRLQVIEYNLPPPVADSMQSSCPYLTSQDLVQCEVTLPGTPYKQIVYSQFQIKHADNIPTMAAGDSGGIAVNCQCIIVTIVIVIVISLLF